MVLSRIVPRGSRASHRALPGGGGVPTSIREVHPVDCALIGSLAHRALARVLYAGASGEAAVDRAVRAVLGEAGVPRCDRGTWVAVSGAVAAYLHRSHPGPGWQLAATEFPLGGAIADFVFLRVGADVPPGPRPAVLVDELKTGLSHRAVGSSRTRGQLVQLIVGGRARWGERLVGVRLVVPALRITHLIRDTTDILTVTETLP